MVALDYDQTRKRYNKLRFRAELFVSFESFIIRTTQRTFADFARGTARSILRRRSPWVVEEAHLDKYPGLGPGLQSVWQKLPAYILFIPVQNVVPHQAVIVGVKTPPDAEAMASILITASRFIQNQSISVAEFFLHHENWSHHPSPTLVLERNHGRPYLNLAAKRLLGSETFIDLEAIVGPTAFREIMKRCKNDPRRSQPKLAFYYPCQSTFWRKIEAVLSVQSERVSLILTDLGIPEFRDQKAGKKELRIWLKSQSLPPVLLSEKKVTTVGRGSMNDLVLKARGVSRQHVVFKWRGKHLTLEDLGSANGVYVNGQRRSQARVNLNDKIEIGPFKFEVLTEADIVPSACLSGEPTRVHSIRNLPILEPEPKSPGRPKARQLKAKSSISQRQGVRSDVILSGSLSQFSFLTLARLFELTEKSGRLRLCRLQEQAEVVFRRGRLIEMQMGSLRGRKVLEQLLLWNSGQFDFSECPPNINKKRLDESRTFSELTGIVKFPKD